MTDGPPPARGAAAEPEAAISPKKPTLIRNCRMSDSPLQPDTLLMPEGVIRLKGTGVDIVRLCDGKRTGAEILAALRKKFPGADPLEIERDAREFLETLRRKRVLDFL